MSLYVWGVDVGTRKCSIATVPFTEASIVGVNTVYVFDQEADGKRPPVHDRTEALSFLEDAVGKFVSVLANHRPPLAVFVEQPTGRFPAPHLMAAWGVCRLAICRNTVAVVESIAVGDWKLEAVGRGDASKDQVADWIDARYPEHADRTTQDEKDALAIACAGVERLRRLNPEMAA